jgi:ABC-type polysaccharide/polyol phosphate transport system ATPase subunit
LHIAQGEAVGILGHNGMGKTTLLRSIIGALLPTQGSIHFNTNLNQGTRFVVRLPITPEKIHF